LYDRATAVFPRYADPSTFVPACTDGVLPVTLALLVKARPLILVFYIMRVFISYDVLKKYKDVVGQARDPQRICEGRGRRNSVSL
jgi:hypothetical protein